MIYAKKVPLCGNLLNGCPLPFFLTERDSWMPLVRETCRNDDLMTVNVWVFGLAFKLDKYAGAGRVFLREWE